MSFAKIPLTMPPSWSVSLCGIPLPFCSSPLCLFTDFFLMLWMPWKCLPSQGGMRWLGNTTDKLERPKLNSMGSERDALYSSCTRVHTGICLLKTNIKADSKTRRFSPAHMPLGCVNHTKLSERIDHWLNLLTSLVLKTNSVWSWFTNISTCS